MYKSFNLINVSTQLIYDHGHKDIESLLDSYMEGDFWPFRSKVFALFFSK